MTHLSPMDILVIQNAIEEYSRKHPGRPVPSAEEALAWKYGGARYRDELLRIRIDSSDPRTGDYFRTYKQLLKERFQQIDIWITAHELEII